MNWKLTQQRKFLISHLLDLNRRQRITFIKINANPVLFNSIGTIEQDLAYLKTKTRTDKIITMEYVLGKHKCDVAVYCEGWKTIGNEYYYQENGNYYLGFIINKIVWKPQGQ